MGQFRASGVELPPGDYGIPAVSAIPIRGTALKSRMGTAETVVTPETILGVGYGRAVSAGGMVYISSIGPVDPDTGMVVGASVKDQSRQCLKNLKAKLEAAGSSLDRVVWANWTLRDPSEFDTFNEEWVRWFPGDAPVGQGTLMPPLQRRAGFRVSIGVIAQA